MSKKQMKSITQEDYKDFFQGKESEALRYAFEIRKFEIELYWKRATYFWAFIVGSMAGYIGVQGLENENKLYISLVFVFLGFVFSVAWFFVNMGSKFWQENWEEHVYLLQEKVIGPLYKIVFRSENSTDKKIMRVIRKPVSPYPFSVSKINQLVSLVVVLCWPALFFVTIPEFSLDAPIDFFVVFVAALSVVVIVFIRVLCVSSVSFYRRIKR